MTESMIITTHLDLAGFLDPIEPSRLEEIISCYSSPHRPLVSTIKQVSKDEEEKKQEQNDKEQVSSDENGEQSDDSDSADSSDEGEDIESEDASKP